MKRSWTTALVGAFCALSVVPAPAGSDKRKDQQKPDAPVDLVWPG